MPAKKQQKDKAPFYLEGGLPASPDSERAILGAVLLDNFALMQALEMNVKADDFALDANRKLFSSMVKMQRQGKAIDLITLVEHIGKHVAEIGGVAYISSLTDGLPHRANIKSYCNIVRDKSDLRKLINLCQKGLADSLEQKDSASVLADLENQLISLVRQDDQKSTSEIASEVFRRISDIRAGNVDPMGLTSSIPDLDELTGGVHAGEYVVLAGRTGHGKSSLARQMAWENSKRGKKVKFFALEMSKANTIECLTATISGVNYSDIRDPRYLHSEDLEKIADAIKQIKDSTVDIDETAGLEITSLAARARSAIMQGAEMVFVDYLQMIHVDGENDPRLRVSKASAVLRDLAKTTGVPIVALSQLKRPEQGSENREPSIYDLKESGDIEQDAFQVWLIYRPRERDDASQRWKWTGVDWIIVGKQRNGPLGNIKVTYDGPRLKFNPRAEEHPAIPSAEAVAAFINSRKFIQHTPIQEELPVDNSGE